MIINVTIALTVIFLGYLVYETVYYKKIRQSFKHVIHVNGTRGKSTVTRLIDAGLRNNGYKTFCKSTGTIPTTINTNFIEKQIRRMGQPNIREQLRIMRQAYKEKAEILVIECMAVMPEMQDISQHKMLDADIVLITNARHDHQDVMGNTKESVADALSHVIPTNGKLIVGESWLMTHYQQIVNKRQAELIPLTTLSQSVSDIDYFEENVKMALTVGEVVGCNRKSFINGMKHYHKDPGALNILRKENTIFINGFSINDPDSIKIVYEKIVRKYNKKDLTILINNRADRAFRMHQQIDTISYIKPKKVMVCGALKRQTKKRIEKLPYNINIQYLEDNDMLLNEDIIFGIGNIANRGLEIIRYFKEGNENV